MNKYHVKLSASQRQRLLQLVRKGKTSARVINRARILLLAHAGKSDEEIAEALQVNLLTIHNIRRRFQTERLALLYDQPRPGQPCKLDGKAEARLTAIACSSPPTGHARWSLRLLADELVRLEVVDAISHKTVGQVLKKTSSSHGKSSSGVSLK
jgi:transposase